MKVTYRDSKMFFHHLKGALRLLSFVLFCISIIIPSMAIPNANQDRSRPTAPNFATTHNASLTDRSADHHSLHGTIEPWAVFPKNPAKVNKVRVLITKYIQRGSVEELSSRNRPEFGGVLLWKVWTDKEEALRLNATFGPDVGMHDCIRSHPR